MRQRLTASILTIALALIPAAGCGPKAIPKLPDIKVTTDADVHAAAIKLLGIMQALGNVLDQASLLEDITAKSVQASTGSRPAWDAPIRAQFVAIAKDGKKINADIESGVLKDWPTIQARVNPIIDEVNTLSNLAKPQGASGWVKLIEAGLQIVLAIVSPGTFGALSIA